MRFVNFIKTLPLSLYGIIMMFLLNTSDRRVDRVMHVTREYRRVIGDAAMTIDRDRLQALEDDFLLVTWANKEVRDLGDAWKFFWRVTKLSVQYHYELDEIESALNLNNLFRAMFSL